MLLTRWTRLIPMLLIALPLVLWQPSAEPVVYAQGGEPVAVSMFDEGTEGWTTTGEATCTPEPCYAETGGNPGGYVFTEDTLQGQPAYFSASAAFLGDVSEAYGRYLLFDLRQILQDRRPNAHVEDVVLVGDGIRLVFDTPHDPPEYWYTYRVPLSAGMGWRKDSLDGPPATTEELQQVLSSLDQLLIRADYISGQANVGLDNVILGSSDAEYRLLLPVVITQP